MPNNPARHLYGYRPLANANKRLRVRDSQRAIALTSRIASAAAQDSSTSATDAPAPTYSQPTYPPEYYEAKAKYGF